MPLIPIPLGPDVLFTIGNGPYADSNIFDNLTGAGIIPMGGGVSIVVYRVSNPVTPFQSDTFARAFTVSPDGSQEWGNALPMGAGGNTGGFGERLDATRALIVYDTAPTQMTFRVLTLNGLTLSVGAAALYSIGGGFDAFGYGARPFKVMSPTTVLFGFRGSRFGPSTEAIRVQLLQVTGTTVTIDNSNALSLYDGPFIAAGGLEMCQVDKYTCGVFWFNGDNSSHFGTVQLNPTFTSMTDVGFGASQLYDGVTYQFLDFRELSLGFVFAIGYHASQLVAEILEFDSGAHTLTKGPIVELLETVPKANEAGTSAIMSIAGHQAVLLTRRKPVDQLQHGRFVVLNLGTFAREIKEIGVADFEMLSPGGQPEHAPEIPVALSPRRVMMAYTPGGGGGITIERAITVTVPIVPSLRWRQRDDCLTPGSATPCICFDLTPGVVCIPPWNFWLTTSVQFGGRVGQRNTYL